MSSTINIVFDNVTDVMNDTIVANVTSSDEREEEVYYQKSMEFIFEVVLLLAVGILGLISLLFQRPTKRDLQGPQPKETKR